MTIGELIRINDIAEVTETTIPSISTTQLCKLDLINEAATEFCKYTLCLPKDKKFNCVGGTQTYSLYTNINDYYMPREEGIWHLRSDTTTLTSTNVWERLKPTSVRELDQEQPSWRNASNSDCVMKYWIDGDIFGTYYTPSSTNVNAFHIYYFAKPVKATALNQYPFTGTTTEDGRLSAYDRVLGVYYKSRLLDEIGYKTDAMNLLKEFYLLCDKAKSELQSRRDLAQSSAARPKSYINQMRGMFRR